MKKYIKWDLGFTVTDKICCRTVLMQVVYKMISTSHFNTCHSKSGILINPNSSQTSSSIIMRTENSLPACDGMGNYILCISR